MIKNNLRLLNSFSPSLINFIIKSQYIYNRNNYTNRPSLQQDVVASVAQDAPFFSY